MLTRRKLSKVRLQVIEKRMHFFYLESIAFERMPLSLIPSHSPLAFALAKACFTSAHKCTLLGVMPPFPPSLFCRQKRHRGDLCMATRPPGRNASRIRKRTRLSGAARIDKSRRVFRNFEEPSIPQMQ